MSHKISDSICNGQMLSSQREQEHDERSRSERVPCWFTTELNGQNARSPGSCQSSATSVCSFD